MTLPQRVKLVGVAPDIMSYYTGRDGSRKPLRSLAGGRATPDMAAALLQLHRDVLAAGGTLLITDCFRAPEEQAAARAKYERWLAAGKPKAASVNFDATTMKAAFVARPGRSGHNGGRSIDVAHLVAAPTVVHKSLKLDWLWERAEPLGFKPIIKTADEGASEAWHFDFRGPWVHVYEHLGYEAGAMCSVLDIGEGAGLFTKPWERWVQAQMWRAGVDLGDIDGGWGKRTKNAAKLLSLKLDAPQPALIAALCALPDQFTVRHVA